MKLTICHLYADIMNIYSDMGNIICLKQRCQWRGIQITIKSVSIKEKLNWQKYDLFFSGGGQDRQQLIVSQDLQKKANQLKAAAEANVPMLVTCGSYQLFGHYFKTHEGVKIPGISIFNAYTVASYQRKIGNIIIKISNPFLKKDPFFYSYQNIVGFENHSGNTYLEDIKSQKSKVKTLPFGTIIKGFGNNGKDKTEGAIYKNVIGTYLHGPVLVKNPHLADWLIKKALVRKYQKSIKLPDLDDSLEWQTHKTAIKRTYQLS